MAILDRLPINNNFLSQTGYQFIIKKAPNLNFFVQKVNLPGISIGPASQPTPFVNIPQPGEHILFDELQVEFKVDEDLRNWLEIFHWMQGLGFPDNFDQYFDLQNVAKTDLGEGVKTDVTVVILNSSKQPTWEVTYREAFPVALSSIKFDAAAQDIEHVTASAMFKYTSYSFNYVKAG